MKFDTSFKNYLNTVKGSPYHILELDSDEFKKAKEDAGIKTSKAEDNEEKSKSLLNYLLYATSIQK